MLYSFPVSTLRPRPRGSSRGHPPEGLGRSACKCYHKTYFSTSEPGFIETETATVKKNRMRQENGGARNESFHLPCPHKAAPSRPPALHGYSRCMLALKSPFLPLPWCWSPARPVLSLPALPPLPSGSFSPHTAGCLTGGPSLRPGGGSPGLAMENLYTYGTVDTSHSTKLFRLNIANFYTFAAVGGGYFRGYPHHEAGPSPCVVPRLNPPTLQVPFIFLGRWRSCHSFISFVFSSITAIQGLY